MAHQLRMFSFQNKRKLLTALSFHHPLSKPTPITEIIVWSSSPLHSGFVSQLLGYKAYGYSSKVL